jgi:hypothetical protein
VNQPARPGLVFRILRSNITDSEASMDSTDQSATAERAAKRGTYDDRHESTGFLSGDYHQLVVWLILVSLFALASSASAQTSPFDDPYLGSYSVDPIRFDDELVTLTTAPDGSSLLSTAFETDESPKLYRNLPGTSYQALRAGRLMGNALEQIVLIRNPVLFRGSQIEVFSGFNPGQRQFFRLDGLLPSGRYDDFAYEISDLDLFDESLTGCSSAGEQTYHDELVVASLNRDTSKITVSVVAFEGVGTRYIDAGADSPIVGDPDGSMIATIESLGEATTGRFALTTGDLRSVNNSGSDGIPEGPREIYISYVNSDGQLVLEGFRYDRTPVPGVLRGDGDALDDARQCDALDDTRTLTRIPVSVNDQPPEIRTLTTPNVVDGDFAILATGGEFLGVEQSPSQPRRGVLVATHRRSDGRLVSRLYESERGADLFAQFQTSTVNLGETPSGEPLLVLPGSEIRKNRIAVPISSNTIPCLEGGVIVLADTQRGPIAQTALLAPTDVQTSLPVWPPADELSQRPLTESLSGTELVAGGAYLRDRYQRPGISACGNVSDAGSISRPSQWEGDIDHFFVTGRDAQGSAWVDRIRLEQSGGATLSNRTRHGVLDAPSGDGPLDVDFTTIDMDVDGDGQADSEIDGALIIRYLAGFRGDALIADLGIDAGDIPAIEALLSDAQQRGRLDVDGDGIATALGDGVMRARALNPAFDSGGIANQAVSDRCQRCSPADIESYLRPPSSSLGPVLAVLADTDGDAAYNSFGQSGSIVWTARGIGFDIVNFRTSEVVLATPPQHIDYLQGQVRNVSLGDSIRSSYQRANAQASSEAIQRERRSSWTTTESTTRSASVSAGVGPISASISGSESTAIQDERNQSFSARDTAEASMSTSTSIIAQSGDLLLTSTRDFDLWRYPAMGLGTETNPVDFVELLVPRASQTEGELEVQNGNTLDEYQVRHIPGNLLSYPARINDYVLPPDAVRPWNPLAGFNDCNPNALPSVCDAQESVNGPLLDLTAQVNGDGEAATTLTLSDAITQSSAAGQSTRLTTSRERTVRAEIGAKGAFKIFTGGASASFEKSFTETDSEAYSDLRTVQLKVQRDQEINVQFGRSENNNATYDVQSLVHFNEQGALQLTFAVDLPDTGAVQFWSENYNSADPGFGKPFMFCSGTLECADRINTSSNRHQIRGVAIRSGLGIDARRASESTGPLITSVPVAGERVQIQTRVYNFSVANPVNDVAVRFYAQALNPDNTPDGTPFLIGEDVIDEIPYRGQFGDDQPNAHMRDAWVIWETQGLGNQDETIRRFDIFAIIDPENNILGETHELIDRFDDPLLVDGTPIDPVPFGEPGEFMQKAGNNYGEFRLALAPAPNPVVRGASSDRPVEARLAPLQHQLDIDRNGNRQVRLQVDVQSNRLDRSIRQIHLQATDEHGRTIPIATPTVFGLNEGSNLIELNWTPPAAGNYTVQARLSHALADGGRPIPVERASISVN